MLRLTLVRRAAKISQLKLSTMTGISASDISCIELGKKYAFPGWRKRIAAALGVDDPDSLFEEVTEPKTAGTPPVPPQEAEIGA